MAAVLWTPCMSLTENFEDIAHCWQDRPAIPIGARTGILPKQIGTEEVKCGHSEIEALILGCEWITPHDPCMYVLDSNATALNARSMRDDPTPSMRRRVRGTGVAAGKGACERLRKIINGWEKPEGIDHRAK